MAVNTIPISSRNLPMQASQTAGGGFTLPQHAFIPGAGTTPVGSGQIASPTQMMRVPSLTGMTSIATPLPGAQLQRATGIRLQRAGSN